MAQSGDSKGSTFSNVQRPAPAPAEQDSIQDSLEELSALADQFVNELECDEPTAEVQPPDTPHNPEALQATLDEMDRLNAPVTPAKTETITLGEDRGEDIDSFLDAVLLGDDAPTEIPGPYPATPEPAYEADPAVPLEPMTMSKESLQAEAEEAVELLDEIADGGDENVDVVCETLPPVADHHAPRPSPGQPAIDPSARVEARPTAQPELLADGNLPAQVMDELVDPTDSALVHEVDHALETICGDGPEEAMPAAAGAAAVPEVPGIAELIEPPSDAALARMNDSRRSNVWPWLVAAALIAVIVGGYQLYRPGVGVVDALVPIVAEGGSGGDGSDPARAASISLGGAAYTAPVDAPAPSIEPESVQLDPEPVEFVADVPAPEPTPPPIRRPEPSSYTPPPPPRERAPKPAASFEPVAVAKNDPNVTFRPDDDAGTPRFEPAITAPVPAPPSEPEVEPEVEPEPEAEPEPEVAPVVVVPSYQPPIPMHRTEPSYPPKALKKGEHGTVVLKVLVDERGKPVRVVVDQGIPGSALEAAAIEAMLNWTFKPAMDNGHAIRGWTTQRFTFTP